MTDHPVKVGTLISRNVRIGSFRTSVRLEREVWDALEDIVRRERSSLRSICSQVGETRYGNGFSSALRMYALTYYMERTPLAPTYRGLANIHTPDEIARSRK